MYKSDSSEIISCYNDVSGRVVHKLISKMLGNCCKCDDDDDEEKNETVQSFKSFANIKSLLDIDFSAWFEYKLINLCK